MITKKRLPVHVKVDIDYDRLAAAIVNANAKANAVEETENNETEQNFIQKVVFFIKVIRYIIFNKKDTKDIMTIKLMGLICSLIFNLVWIIFFLGSIILAFVVPFYCFKNLTVWGYILAFILAFSLAFLLFLISLMFRQSANEIERSEDKNFVSSVFSGLIAVASLIVAIIALAKTL